MTPYQRIWDAQQKLRQAREDFAVANKRLIAARKALTKRGRNMKLVDEIISAQGQLEKSIRDARAAADILGPDGIMAEGSVL